MLGGVEVMVKPQGLVQGGPSVLLVSPQWNWGYGIRFLRWELLKVPVFSPWVFEKITLMRCYSYTIKFTLLKCKIQWFLVLSQYCVSIIVFPEHFDYPKEKPVPIKQLLSFFPTPPASPPFGPFSPCQPRIYFLSLFWTLHINGLRQNVAFGVFHL